jgi:hypothetical protein
MKMAFELVILIKDIPDSLILGVLEPQERRNPAVHKARRAQMEDILPEVWIRYHQAFPNNY